MSQQSQSPLRTPLVSVVVPVFNNAQTLPSLFERLSAVEETLHDQNVALELIFVDDGSSDRSLAVLHSFQEKSANITVVKLTRNFGAIAASKRGLSYVTGDAFTILAADLQDPPELLTQMVPLWAGGAKYIICERESRDDPIFSRLFSRVYYVLVRTFVIGGYPKGGFDIALMDKDLLQPLASSGKNIMTPLYGYWLGYQPLVLRYHRPKRQEGKSGWTFKKKLKVLVDVFLGFSTLPIRLISVFGGFVALGAFGYGASIFINALAQKIPVEGFATLATLLTFLLGVAILMLGVMGEYLSRILDEVNKRPQSVVDHVWRS